MTPGLDQQDGALADPSLARYVQGVEDRIAASAGLVPRTIRLTRGHTAYLYRASRQALYVSGALLAGMENEAELAGLLAHELAHRAQGPHGPPCVLSLKAAESANAEGREEEIRATAAAMSYLKTAGFDPDGVLTGLEQLLYEHPDWAEILPPEDLAALRMGLETDPLPPGGYRIGSSAFLMWKQKMAAQ